MVNIGTVSTFAGVQSDKAQALKPLEEAAEVFSAWQCLEYVEKDPPDLINAFLRRELVSECCDLIQAICNLLAALGVEDITHEMRLCKIRNEECGRVYE